MWRYAFALKSVERRGWKKLPLKRVESVADHSFALSLMALIEAEHRKFDVETAMKLALLHDLEEAIIGDLTPRDKQRLGSKRVEEKKQKAIDRILRALPEKTRGGYRRLWKDLRKLKTNEARLVHDLDKLEMALQANEYGKKVGQRRVKQFYLTAREEIEDPRLSRAIPLRTRAS